MIAIKNIFNQQIGTMFKLFSDIQEDTIVRGERGQTTIATAGDTTINVNINPTVNVNGGTSTSNVETDNVNANPSGAAYNPFTGEFTNSDAYCEVDDGALATVNVATASRMRTYTYTFSNEQIEKEGEFRFIQPVTTAANPDSHLITNSGSELIPVSAGPLTLTSGTLIPPRPYGISFTATISETVITLVFTSTEDVYWEQMTATIGSTGHTITPGTSTPGTTTSTTTTTTGGTTSTTPTGVDTAELMIKAIWLNRATQIELTGSSQAPVSVEENIINVWIEIAAVVNNEAAMENLARTLPPLEQGDSETTAEHIRRLKEEFIERITVSNTVVRWPGRLNETFFEVISRDIDTVGATARLTVKRNT